MSGTSMRDPAAAERRFTRTMLFITGGLLVWMMNFVFVYVFAALACARGFAAMRFIGIGIVPGITTLASIAAGAVTGGLLIRAARSRVQDEYGSFLRFVTCATCALALVTLAWIALPPLVVSACAR